MTKKVIEPSDLSAMDMWLVVGPTIAVSFTPLVGWPYLQRHFCPSDTLLAGYVETALGPVGASLITASVCFFIFLGLLFRRIARAKGAKSLTRTSQRVFQVICLVLTILALVPWLNILSSYACFSASRLYLHSSPFGGAATYAWSDVRHVTPFCKARSSKAITERIFKLDLEMTDGRIAAIGFPGSRIQPHYAELKAALIGLPRNQDWREWLRLSGCPAEYRDLFAHS
jgi:hypothetical protein